MISLAGIGSGSVIHTKGIQPTCRPSVNCHSTSTQGPNWLNMVTEVPAKMTSNPLDVSCGNSLTHTGARVTGETAVEVGSDVSSGKGVFVIVGRSVIVGMGVGLGVTLGVGLDVGVAVGLAVGIGVTLGFTVFVGSKRVIVTDGVTVGVFPKASGQRATVNWR